MHVSVSLCVSKMCRLETPKGPLVTMGRLHCKTAITFECLNIQSYDCMLRYFKRNFVQIKGQKKFYCGKKYL